MKLSPNFNLKEFTRSQTAARLGIDNHPTQRILIQLVYTALLMQEVRALCGDKPISVSSGYRSGSLNREITKHDRQSDHMLGAACDFTVHGMSNQEVFDKIKYSTLGYKKLILEFPDSDSGGWIHIAAPLIGEVPSRKNLIARSISGKTHYEAVA